jgi:hypothetical protein
MFNMEDLEDEILNYCKVNNINNVDDFKKNILKVGFTIEKFGAVPNARTTEKIIEKVIEIPVEKNVYITNDEELKNLTNKINDLEKLVGDYKSNINNYEEENKTLKNKINDLEEKLSKKNKDIYGE